MAAGLQLHLGFSNPLLIEYGIKPRQKPRGRRSATRREPPATPAPAPAEGDPQ